MPRRFRRGADAARDVDTARAAMRLAWMLHRTNDRPGLVWAALVAANLADARGSLRVSAPAFGLLCAAAATRGMLRLAGRLHTRALSDVRHDGDPSTVAEVMMQSAINAWSMGRWDDMRSLASEGAAAAAVAGDRFLQGASHSVSGTAWDAGGVVDDLRRQAFTGLELLPKETAMGMAGVGAREHLLRADIYQGRADADVLRDGERLLSSLTWTNQKLRVASTLAFGHLLQGNDAAAVVAVDRALDAVQQQAALTTYVGVTARYLLEVTLTLCERKQARGAAFDDDLVRVDAALAVLAQLAPTMRPLASIQLRMKARRAALVGDSASARALLDKAVAAATKWRAPLEVAWSRLARARLAPSNVDRADDRADDRANDRAAARAYFVDIGASALARFAAS